MHSRNSCKTLKCPRCNWHYKYQETLEIHMKEKHPENELNCLYCLTNQSHPRLARGETYTCGYKPYRCEVCNYSTTTKGNLSIHMTSDKHMTNIQHYEGSTSAASVGKLQVGPNSSADQSSPVAGAEQQLSLGQQHQLLAAAAAAVNQANQQQQQQQAGDQQESCQDQHEARSNHGEHSNDEQQQLSSQQQTTLANIIAIQSQAMAAAAAASAKSEQQSGGNGGGGSSAGSSLAGNSPASSSRNNSPPSIAGQLGSANEQQQHHQQNLQQQQQQQSSSSPSSTNQQQPSGAATAAGGQQQDQAAAAMAAAILLAQHQQNPNALEDYINSQEIAKDSYDDPSRKYKCHRCKVAFTRQSYLTAHNKTLFHRKGEKLAYPMEKYLDPNRPFKCDICKESFTQKSILLVHNNSVSHLNKLRQTKKANEQQQQQQQQQQQPATPVPVAVTPTPQTPTPTSTPMQQQVHHQQQHNPLAALANDPMAALMSAAGNPMAALMGGMAAHPMMPFMMNPHLMAAAALAAAQTSRMLGNNGANGDPMQQAAANLFGQASPMGGVATSQAGTGNPFADFQSQQQQLMQQAASQLAAAAAASSASTSSAFSSLGNLMSAQTAAELLQQSMVQSMAPTTAANNNGNNNNGSTMMNVGNAVSDANLVSSTLDSLHQSRNHHHLHHHQNLGSNNNNKSNGLGGAGNGGQDTSAAQAAAAAAAAAAFSVQQQKRARTRISEEQLRILRQYFDINNSPTEEQLQEMSVKSELPLKVIKHWFRNTLFKERQKNKDSPYNFNNPPMLALNLEEYERTGEAKVTPISDLVSNSISSSAAVVPAAPSVPEATSSLPQLPPIKLESTTSSLHPTSTTCTANLASNNGAAVSIEATAAAVVSDVVAAVADNHELAPPSADPNELCASKRSAPVSMFEAPNSSLKRVKLEQLEEHQQQFQFKEAQAPAPPSSQLQLSQAIQEQFSELTRRMGLNVDPNLLMNASGTSSNLNDTNNNQNHSRCDSDEDSGDGAYGGESRLQRSALRRTTNANQAADKGSASRGKLSPVSDENAGIGPSSTWSPLQLQQQHFDQTWATVNNHLSQQGLSSKTSESSSHSVNSSTNSKSKRANRTRFSDRQVKILQESFERNAYPKDDDLGCLSKQLGLSPRVIVVWFQNARQKARKVYENRPNSASMSEDELDNVEGGQQHLSQSHHPQLQQQQQQQHHLHNQQHHLGGRRADASSPMSHDGSSVGGLHSPAGDSMADYQQQLLMNSSGGSNNTSGASGGNQAPGQQQQRPGDMSFMGESGNDESRDRCEDELLDEHRGEEMLDEEDGEHHGEEEDDDDEFMSAAQMMRHQQQQRQQQQQQQQQQQHHQQQPSQHQHQSQQLPQQQQQFAAAAAAAGLFGGDASNLLSLIAANQAAGANNLLGADIHQRNMMEALNSAMRGVVQANANGAMLAAAAGGNPLSSAHHLGGLAGQQHQSSMNSGGPNNNSGSSNNNSLNLNESSNASLGATSNMSGGGGQGGDRNTSSSASQRDKRLRTQISPEQLDYLYQKYQVESNPSRKTLESIAQDVGLSKRVVQVWFQNTRARERRGQLRMSHVMAQQQRNANAAGAGQAQANNSSGLPTSAPVVGMAPANGNQTPKLPMQNGLANMSNGQQQQDGLNQELKESSDQSNGGPANAAAAAAAAAAAQLANLTALMRGQLLEGGPGFAPLDLSGSKALFAGLNQLGALGVAGLNFDPQPR